MPVMLVYGDSDMFRLEHVVEFYHLLGGGLKDAGLDAGEYVEEPAGDSSRPHPLRDVRLTSAGAPPCAHSSTAKAGEELGRSGGGKEVAAAAARRIPWRPRT